MSQPPCVHLAMVAIPAHDLVEVSPRGQYRPRLYSGNVMVPVAIMASLEAMTPFAWMASFARENQIMLANAQSV